MKDVADRLALVGHANHAGSWDRKALVRFARSRHYSPVVGAEVALVQLENELAMWWAGRRQGRHRDRERQAVSHAMIRGLIQSCRAVAVYAHREPRLPITGGRS